MKKYKFVYKCTTPGCDGSREIDINCDYASPLVMRVRRFKCWNCKRGLMVCKEIYKNNKKEEVCNG